MLRDWSSDVCSSDLLILPQRAIKFSELSFPIIVKEWCDFGLVGNFANQIADIAWSAMEARNFLEKWVRSPDYVRSQLSYTPYLNFSTWKAFIFTHFTEIYMLIRWSRWGSLVTRLPSHQKNAPQILYDSWDHCISEIMCDTVWLPFATIPPSSHDVRWWRRNSCISRCF